MLAQADLHDKEVGDREHQTASREDNMVRVSLSASVDLQQVMDLQEICFMACDTWMTGLARNCPGLATCLSRFAELEFLCTLTYMLILIRELQAVYAHLSILAT